MQTNFLEVDLQIPPTDIYTYLYVHAYMCIKYHVALSSRVFRGVRARVRAPPAAELSFPRRCDVTLVTLCCHVITWGVRNYCIAQQYRYCEYTCKIVCVYDP